jgi:hypothetical protein
MNVWRSLLFPYACPLYALHTECCPRMQMSGDVYCVYACSLHSLHAVSDCECLEKFYYFYACALHALRTNCVSLEHNCLDNLTISVHVPFVLFILVVNLEQK